MKVFLGMQMTDAPIRGYLVVTVAEASGRNKEEDDVWDPGFYEGYVKGQETVHVHICMSAACEVVSLVDVGPRHQRPLI